MAAFLVFIAIIVFTFAGALYIAVTIGLGEVLSIIFGVAAVIWGIRYIFKSN